MRHIHFLSVLYCLMSVPVVSQADDDGFVTIPEPPNILKKKPHTNDANTQIAPGDEPASVPPVAAPEPPDIPMSVRSREKMEPDITIIRKGQKVIQEYRRGGELYMVKVIPDKGPAYYLIDINGDGKLVECTQSDLDKGLSINQWKLLEWD